MQSGSVRATVYIEPGLHQALRLKAVTGRRTISAIVNDAVREALREDEEDLAAFTERSGETPVPYEDFLAQLKADGTL